MTEDVNRPSITEENGSIGNTPTTDIHKESQENAHIQINAVMLPVGENEEDGRHQVHDAYGIERFSV